MTKLKDINDNTALGELSADGYGIALFSPDIFNAFLKEKKCKAKKYISYFNKHKELFFDFIRAGVIVPFYGIASLEYAVFTTINEETVEIPADYEQVYLYPGFYIKIGATGKLCFSSLDFLEYHKGKIDEEVVDYGRSIPSGSSGTPEWYNSAVSLQIEPGEYQFDLYGLAKLEKGERESKNYGFLFSFTKTTAPINENFEKCDNDKQEFKIKTFQCERLSKVK